MDNHTRFLDAQKRLVRAAIKFHKADPSNQYEIKSCRVELERASIEVGTTFEKMKNQS